MLYEWQKNGYTALQIDHTLTATHIENTFEKVQLKWVIEEVWLYMEEYVRLHPYVKLADPEDSSDFYKGLANSKPPKPLPTSDAKHYDGNTIHHHYKFSFYECTFNLKRIMSQMHREVQNTSFSITKALNFSFL